MALLREARDLADRIDRFNSMIGRTVAWCALFIVVVQFAIVMMRYVLGVGSLWLQESLIYANAAMFLLAAGWTLKDGGHVRVDVFYSEAAPRTRALIDLLGAVCLLLPVMAVILIYGLPYIARSWAILEHSRETSGLPLVYLLKSLMVVFALTLGLQGISQAIGSILVLRGAVSSNPRS